MKVGFTGTRDGMTERQQETIRELLHNLEPSEVHHGECVGADEQFGGLAEFWIEGDGWRRRPCIAAHPSNILGMTASTRPDLRFPAKPPLERNRDIVDAADLLIAAPRGEVEEQRSGTWATIRYARKRRKAIQIVWPNGNIQTIAGT